MIKLLLVEDDVNLNYIIKAGLEVMIGGYEVITTANGKEGLVAWRTQNPDIIVADLDMPVMDGLAMVARIRETDGNIPILMATGKGSPKDVMLGYEYGANNYIKKPFLPEELDVHVRALLKMMTGARFKDETKTCNIGSYILDPVRATLSRSDSGMTKYITPREAQILKILLENRGEVVKRGTLLQRIWDSEDDFYASRSLDVLVGRLRKTLSNDKAVEIKSLRGTGFILFDNHGAI
jgi:DNA-binding response OmpR family regulator